MKTFKSHLNKSLEDKDFSYLYNEEKKLIELALKIHDVRDKSGLSQLEVANKAHVTQQQLSKLENGINCNIMTFLKVCNALDLSLDFKQSVRV